MSDVKRQSILVVTRNFPPLTGGMERLMQNTVQCLSGRFDVTLIGPKGSRSVSAAAQTIECPSSPYLFLVVALLRGLLHCATRRYTFVVGGSGLVAPLVVLFAWLARASSVTFVHGLDLVVNSRVYQTIFIPMIRKCETIVANSKNTQDIAVTKGCDPDRIKIVNPGTDIHEELSRAESGDTRYPKKTPDEQIVLFVGRFVKRKGLYPFIRRSWPSIAAKSPRARLVIIGEPPEKAIAEKPDNGQEAGQEQAPQLRPDVRLLGSVDDETLWYYYGLADVLVFPGIEVDGDVEGFGMVAIEAAACGTPTVAFRVGGVPDAVVDGENGRLVHPLDYDAFAHAVNKVLSTRLPSAESCRAHAQRFSWDKYGCRLNSVFERRD